LDVVRKVAATKQGPVYLHGWDESGWGDRSLPTLAELDGVIDRPLGLARVDGHLLLANSPALEATHAASEPGVETDDAGAPTGRLTAKAGQVAKRWFATNLSEHDVEELQLEAASLAVAFGVTTIHEMSMPAERGMRDLDRHLDRDGPRPAPDRRGPRRGRVDRRADGVRLRGIRRPRHEPERLLRG
jgi:predicted amidohydrolase YtcJ